MVRNGGGISIDGSPSIFIRLVLFTLQNELVMLCSFGLPVTSTEDTVCRHSGVLRTKVPDCQFVSVEQEHFHRILHQVYIPVLYVNSIYL